MTLSHLNSDQRQYFWLAAVLAIVFVYAAIRVPGVQGIAILITAASNGACAIAIYRNWRHAHWIYLVACLAFLGWTGLRGWTAGYSGKILVLWIAGLMSCTGFYWLRLAMRAQQPQPEAAPAPDTDDLFVLPASAEPHVDALIDSYTAAFGTPQWVHHIVPKVLWLHRYADHVITIPPTDRRATWLYGTLLISALSEARVELILEYPKEDTIAAIGTLARLTDYYLHHAPLEEWNTMGVYAFFGEESPVRGILICPVPAHLAAALPLAGGPIALRYVVGITLDQLTTAQARDDAEGNSAGAKALHAELRIATEGIAHLSI